MPTLTQPKNFDHPVTGAFYYDSRGNRISEDTSDRLYVSYKVTPHIIFKWTGSECAKIAWWSPSMKRWVLY